VIYGFLAVIIARSVPMSWRWLPYNLAGIVVLMVAIARLYLGVHWLSDIIGSLALGICWVAILGIAYYRHTKAETHWLGLGLSSMLVIVLATGFQGWRMHSSDLARYMPTPEITEIKASDWSTHSWLQLPGRRKDAREKLNHPLNIQYAGKLELVTTTLKAEGWDKAPALSFGDTLKFLSPDQPIQELPLLPQVHDGRHEALILTKTISDEKRLVLRLWPAFVRIQPGNKPLWIGNATEQHKQEVAGIFTFPITSEIFEEPFKILLDDSSTMPHKLHEGERDVILWRSSN
jgi:undecaprenyl-diphosphatase